MQAAEDWGRRKGAVVAVTDTNLCSPLSVPFYEHPMGYLRQAVILRKPPALTPGFSTRNGREHQVMLSAP